jgi:hypothetical protein
MVLAIGLRFRGFKPGRGGWILESRRKSVERLPSEEK